MVTTIHRSSRASFTPAFALIVEGWNEMVQNGWTSEGRGDSPVNSATDVIYAENDGGEVVGVLCFEPDAKGCQLHVVLAYVEPTSRKQGVFTALWVELAAVAKARGILKIIETLHVENKTARDVFDKRKEPAFLIYETMVG